jgi:hypothetical protein
VEIWIGKGRDLRAMSANFPPPEDDWWITGPGKRTCRKCGEDRMTHEVTDFRGVQVFCPVCAASWWVLGGPKPWRA